MTSAWNPEVVCTNILSAPRLHELIWNFDRIIGLVSVSDFGKEQADWLTSVVRHAHSQGCALREVEIQFYPDDVAYRDEMEGQEPLRLMEVIKKEMEGMGMNLKYIIYGTKEEALEEILEEQEMCARR